MEHSTAYTGFWRMEQILTFLMVGRVKTHSYIKQWYTMRVFILSLGQGFTGLHHAAGGGHPECFHCLLEHGAEPSVCTLGGDNALDIARKRGKPRIISKASKINQSS